MSLVRLFYRGLAPFLLMLSANTVIAEEIDPHQLVSDATGLILSTIEEQQSIHGDDVNAEMVNSLLTVLEPVIDFDSIARAVAGRHWESIDSAQTQRYLSVFRNTMVRLYLQSFIAFEINEVKVLEPAANFDASSGRVMVQTQANGSSGSAYAVNYSMRTNAEGQWKVRNVIIDGINLGLTYRNQFDGAMSRYNMDVDAVIANWDEDAVVEEQ